jgi:hypothetical protein
MIGLEMLFQTKLEPSELLFGTGIIDEVVVDTDEVVAEKLAKHNVNGWDYEKAIEAIKQARQRAEHISYDLWLYYSITYFDEQELETYDIFSAATLLTSIITGWYGGFGSELYDKERKIEQRWRFLENRLIEMGCEATTIAKIAIEFLTDQYKKPREYFDKFKEPSAIY